MRVRATITHPPQRLAPTPHTHKGRNDDRRGHAYKHSIAEHGHAQSPPVSLAAAKNCRNVGRPSSHLAQAEDSDDCRRKHSANSVAPQENWLERAAARGLLDPFGGAGTTLIAAEKTQRRARLD
jgi:hypothetical protein